jgi:hypothetical protein
VPIRPENVGRYPADWSDISKRIRTELRRTGGRCECTGQCGDPHDGGRCRAIHGKPSPGSGKLVVLTTAHLDHTPENCTDENLLAMCQRCHLAYDADHHAATRRAVQAQAWAAAGQLTMELP